MAGLWCLMSLRLRILIAKMIWHNLALINQLIFFNQVTQRFKRVKKVSKCCRNSPCHKLQQKCFKPWSQAVMSVVTYISFSIIAREILGPFNETLMIIFSFFHQVLNISFSSHILSFQVAHLTSVFFSARSVIFKNWSLPGLFLFIFLFLPSNSGIRTHDHTVIGPTTIPLLGTIKFITSILQHCHKRFY